MMKIPSGFLGYFKNQINLNDVLKSLADLLNDHGKRIADLEKDLATQTDLLARLPDALELHFRRQGILAIQKGSD